MGLLVDGVWHDQWYDTAKSGGRFQRNESIFRNWVTADGTAGPSGRDGFEAEAGRYHLYVSLACPWAHRTLIFRALKKLEDVITVSVVHWHMGEQGWVFQEGRGCTADAIGGAKHLHEVYTRALSDYSGRVTVPILWDKKTGTIVSNESSEIIRMLNTAFDAWGDAAIDFYPEDLRQEIEAVNERVYHTVNNGVYKCGFATSQEAYEEAFAALFDSMSWLEDRLSQQRYLTGNRITEADWRLFTTMVRFDPVYFGHFKCNRQRLVDLPNLWGHTRELFQIPGVAGTVDFHHIKHHYYGSHVSVNPTGVVPLGPDIDFLAQHGREPLTV
ncbi:glutathione S-transferase family protein [Pelagibius sp. Alg239-R121]|uniref:glutathione S-transferase family protein n=1 Tax=Pelagibius sp. Alg239-R121 TaxID=2993448 RepID=UPI0024A67DF3|nr:glutathione S-transferase family protein [Pelagibius sp. Alg239-R121]